MIIPICLAHLLVTVGRSNVSIVAIFSLLVMSFMTGNADKRGNIPPLFYWKNHNLFEQQVSRKTISSFFLTKLMLACLTACMLTMSSSLPFHYRLFCL